MHRRHHGCLRGLLILLALAIIATSCSEEKCTNTCGGDGSGSGTALRDSIRIEDLDFVRNKYFFTVYPYDIDYGPDQDLNVFTDVQVYLDDGIGTNNESAVHAYAFMDPATDAAQEPQTGWDSLDCAFEGDFDVLMPNTHYVIDPRTGEIVLLTPLGATHTLAVRYTHGNSSESETVGGYMPDSLALKMIRPNDEEMRNRWAIWKEALKL